MVEFAEFITNTQKFQWSFQRIQETYSKFANDQGNMDIDHFTAFLQSARNSVLVKDNVPRDLNNPITDYFINSSHNTYLLSDQLVGDSSVEGYIRALQKGCRCVELDCWDGPSGQPIIFHGRTL